MLRCTEARPVWEEVAWSVYSTCSVRWTSAGSGLSRCGSANSWQRELLAARTPGSGTASQAARAEVAERADDDPDPLPAVAPPDLHGVRHAAGPAVVAGGVPAVGQRPPLRRTHAVGARAAHGVAARALRRLHRRELDRLDGARGRPQRP